MVQFILKYSIYIDKLMFYKDIREFRFYNNIKCYRIIV